MRCPKCGAPIPDNPTICESCGTRFQVLPGDDVKLKKRNQRMAILIILFMVLVVIAGVLVFVLIVNSKGGASDGDNKVTSSVESDVDTDDDDDDDDDTVVEGGSLIQGLYKVVAVEAYGQWIYTEDFTSKEEIISIKIKQNGNGVFSMGKTSEKVKWRKDGSKIEFTLKNGTGVGEMMGDPDSWFEWSDGVILYHTKMETEGMSGTTMFAGDGEDLSEYDIMSVGDIQGADDGETDENQQSIQ